LKFIGLFVKRVLRGGVPDRNTGHNGIEAEEGSITK
jgi:hypothetical protein